jgi:predicted peptidase
LPKLLEGGDGPLLHLPFLVVAPQCPGDAHWCDPAVLAALGRLADRLVEDREADARRLAVAGFSMGGIGAFCLALQAPRRFAALVSVCGACEEPERLEELAHLPQWIAWAEDDEIVRLSVGSREVVARLQKYGKLIARPYCLGPSGEGGAHARTADAAFAEPDLYRWLASVLTVA